VFNDEFVTVFDSLVLALWFSGMKGRAEWEIGLRLFFFGTRRRVDRQIFTEVSE